MEMQRILLRSLLRCAQWSGRNTQGQSCGWERLRFASAIAKCEASSGGGQSHIEAPSNKKKKRKLRLDELLVERFPEHHLKTLQSFIAQGKVTVDGRKVDKAGHKVADTSNVLLNATIQKYASRAGVKLEAALEHFEVEVDGKCVLDCGISTGGFTDCLLKHGAKLVYGVDVAYGEVAYHIRQDPRVILFEKTNFRTLDADLVEHPVDLITLDLSFISVLKVMPTVCSILQPRGELVVLIKPQFEAARDEVEEGGVVTDPEVHEQVIKKVVQGIEETGIRFVGYIESPILGADSKNKEFLAYFSNKFVELPPPTPS